MLESSEIKKIRESQTTAGLTSRNLVQEDVFYSTILALKCTNSVTWET